jgi:hypothetical protein
MLTKASLKAAIANAMFPGSPYAIECAIAAAFERSIRRVNKTLASMSPHLDRVLQAQRDFHDVLDRNDLPRP